MFGRLGSDRGQAFPIYIVAVVGLLFAALVFFVVGMASVTRSDAQGAADAAALAAAREARDQAFVGLNLPALEPRDWEDLVKGRSFRSQGACSKAVDFAARNDAKAECQASVREFTVSVRTNRPVGKSAVPASAGMHAVASARAAIEPRCTLRSAKAPSPAPTATATGATPRPTPSPGELGVTIVCKGEVLKLDPAEPGPLSRLARTLFTVRLVD
ncbi:hypothetical protein EF903_18605 [Streptomyces sp. WAC05292]|nr:hypothetical protein EF903_18605 [Streptomyces sp. WAC05292]